jgi:anti-sigma B factor antagonist
MMEFSAQRIENVDLIRLKGRVDHNSAKEFENAIKPYLNEDAAEKAAVLLFDMSELTFMTSAGLRILMIAAKTCTRQGRELAVAALLPMIEEIFKISRFDLVLKIFPTVRSALEVLSPQAVARP